MVRSKLPGKEEDLKVFEFNEQGGKLGFTPMHFAINFNNDQLVYLLLSSKEENISQTKADFLGRIPIDLCKYISVIYKTVKKALES